jgi:release factor glutamine methyltransferase
VTTVDAMVAAARAALTGVIPSPDVDAVVLAAHVLDVEPGEVRRRMILRSPVDEIDAARLQELVEERLMRVPLQHLTGRSFFRGLALSVGPGVFVPRPETEVVAGLAIEAALELEAPVVVDLCTGSGAIALAVADEVWTASVYAVELDPQAHAWAQRNVDRHAHTTEATIRLRLGDATSAFPELDGRADIVVSNPPYIPTGMVPLDPEVRDHDPELALYGGSEDGLAIPLAVAARAAELLRPGGLLVMEHADSQGETLPRALQRTGVWTEVADHDDLTGRPRATTARRA